MSKFIRKIALLFMVCGLAVSVSSGTDFMDKRMNDEKCDEECLRKSWEQFKVEYKPYYEACIKSIEYRSPGYWEITPDRKNKYYDSVVCGGIGDVFAAGGDVDKNGKIKEGYLRYRSIIEDGLFRAEIELERKGALKAYDEAKKAEFKAKYPNAK